jgi:hypothetical protein
LVYLLVFVALSTVLMSGSKALRTGYLAISGVLFLLAIGNLITAEDLPTTGPNGEEIKLLPGEGTWVPTLALIFLFVSLAYLIISYRKHYRVAASEEEDITSREFWMFIGSLVLSLSAIHITVQTSVNVGNIFMAPFEGFFHSIHESTHWEWAKRMADHSFEAPGDKERFDLYHRIEIPLLKRAKKLL